MRNKGFTLIELMIVVAIILIIAAIAVPNLLQSRIRANEADVIAQLRNYVTAQEKFRDEGASALPASSIFRKFIGNDFFYVTTLILR